MPFPPQKKQPSTKQPDIDYPAFKINGGHNCMEIQILLSCISLTENKTCEFHLVSLTHIHVMPLWSCY